MALKAGYVGIKRALRDKITNIVEGWQPLKNDLNVLGGKNLLMPRSEKTVTDAGITYILNDDDSVTIKGTTTATSLDRWRITLPPGKYILHGRLSSIIWVGLWDYTNNTYFRSNANNDDSDFILTEPKSFGFTIRVGHPSIIEEPGVEIYPMIYYQGISDTSFAPYALTNHLLSMRSEDMKNDINAIITAATGAADFAAFKTAMGAITPVTRSLSLTKEDINEEVKEDVEPEKTVTKKRTTKKTEEV